MAEDRLPDVRVVGLFAPFRWLALGWRDMMAAPLPSLVYGLIVAALSFGLTYALLISNAAFWALVLSCGFVFVAPMLAMGLYEAGRRLDAGERVSLPGMAVVRAAFRQDVAYLGLALLLIYLLWGRIAQIVYGLSTFRLHRTIPEFVQFALSTSEGHTMLISGTIVGGVIAFFTFCLVVVSAPMLLDRRANVFAATATSFRAAAANFTPMLLWAALITIFVAASALTGFAAFAVIFPWLGFASWRAYRDLVAAPAA